MKKTVKRAPLQYVNPIYAKAGRVVHTYRSGVPDTFVMDDFGNAVEVKVQAVLFYLRGPNPSYQPNY